MEGGTFSVGSASFVRGLGIDHEMQFPLSNWARPRRARQEHTAGLLEKATLL